MAGTRPKCRVVGLTEEAKQSRVVNDLDARAVRVVLEKQDVKTNIAVENTMGAMSR